MQGAYPYLGSGPRSTVHTHARAAATPPPQPRAAAGRLPAPISITAGRLPAPVRVAAGRLPAPVRVAACRLPLPFVSPPRRLPGVQRAGLCHRRWGLGLAIRRHPRSRSQPWRSTEASAAGSLAPGRPAPSPLHRPSAGPEPVAAHCSLQHRATVGQDF
ncbi:hypothetical protein U9M48_036420 [Paspalum notatum var. saurae]|uniref:Uncharacterized protein n=1 Tax=Paspalum notatum var. saurae TaxID=547442 RepID=A0AAQ3UD50_PASNO